MSLAIVVPFVNNYPLTRAAICTMKAYAEDRHTDIIALDNGSDEEGLLEILRDGTIVQFAHNLGAYEIFSLIPKLIQADIIAIFHNDLFVHEPGFDKRIVKAFDDFPQLGLVGFVGSNEIDESGGRGLGTMSNFQGNRIGWKSHTWQGSTAEIHGRRMTGLARAAVVDGCAMIFRRDVLEAIPFWPNFPPHHFYDRLLSCQVMELGHEVAVMGVACDHIGGQTAGGQSYHDLAKDWCRRHGIVECGRLGWDYQVYLEAERQWLEVYRDGKHMVPVTVPEMLT